MRTPGTYRQPPTPLRVAARIVDLALEDANDVSQVAQAIKADPVLAARVIRAANSALYARRRRIYTLREAFVVLGVNTTLNIALSFSLVNIPEGRSHGGLDYPLVWRRSLLAGIAASLLGDTLGRINPAELFLVGPMQDMGMLAIDAAMPEFYNGIATEFDHRKLARYEREWLHADHGDVGAWLLAKWHMPEYWQRAVASSDRSMGVVADNIEAPFAACIALSGDLADIWLTDRDVASAGDLLTRAQSFLGLRPKDLYAVLDQMGQHMPAIEDVYETRLLNPRAAQVIMNRAQDLLARN